MGDEMKNSWSFRVKGMIEHEFKVNGTTFFLSGTAEWNSEIEALLKDAYEHMARHMPWVPPEISLIECARPPEKTGRTRGTAHFQGQGMSKKAMKETDALEDEKGASDGVHPFIYLYRNPESSWSSDHGFLVLFHELLHVCGEKHNARMLNFMKRFIECSFKEDDDGYKAELLMEERDYILNARSVEAHNEKTLRKQKRAHYR